MSVLSRSALESSPLADLHAIASELGIDGYRRLRKADLVAAIIERQGGDPAPDEDDGDDPVAERPARRSRRGRGGGGGGGGGGAQPREPREPRDADADRDARSDRSDRSDRVAEGVVELLDNGSAFLRVSPPDPSDDDVYISGAQVRRCELVSGDRVAGPVRPPRRSERYPSLARVDTINGRSAEEVSEGTRYEDLPVAWPAAKLDLGSGNKALTALAKAAPLGRGSRAVIAGAHGSGRTLMLFAIAGALAPQEDLEVTVVLTGVRPEEVPAWNEAPATVAGVVALGGSSDAQAQAIERALDTAKRVAARGGHAVVLIDTLDQLPDGVARRSLAAARSIAEGGSVTVIATAGEPLGGETTVVTLTGSPVKDVPVLDPVGTATMRADLLAN